MRVRARKCEEDGIVFDSLRERERYRELKMLQKAGEIRELKCHTKFVFVVNGVKVAKYTADFTYIKANLPVVEDAKGFKKSRLTGKMLPRVDREFGLKRKLMSACFGLDVVIV